MSSSFRRQSRLAKRRAPKPDSILKLLAAPLSNSFGAKSYHPRGARTFSVRNPLHLVLKSSIACASYSFLSKARELEGIIRKQAKKARIHISEVANCGNHFHLLIEAPARKNLNRFVRAICGLIVRKVFGAERGRNDEIAQLLQKRRGFFDARPFSRVVSWGKERSKVLEYLSTGKPDTVALEDLKDSHLHAAITRLLQRCSLVPIGFG